MRYRKVCAWCETEMDTAGTADPAGPISHGICSACALEFSKGIPMTVKQVLDLIHEPVLLMGENAEVLSANRKGEELLDKPLAALDNLLGGDAIRCVHAGKPGGCGRTVHCKSCTIRNSIMTTLKTGIALEGVEAFQILDFPEGQIEARFLISTERVGDRILLRVDSMETRPVGSANGEPAG